MTAIEIDSTNSSLWLVRFPKVWDGTDYQDLMSESIERNPTAGRLAIMMDMRLSDSGMSLQDRNQAVTILKEHADWASKAIVCTVRVATNTILRAALTVYDWDTASLWPRKTVVRGEVAEAWARGRLTAEGIECSPEPVWRE